MNHADFSPNAPSQLLPAHQDIHNYLAFIPNPLPPELLLDTALFSALSDADRALEELAGLGRTMPNPDLLIGPFLRREAVLSSRIEGTQTEIADLYAYEAGQAYLPGMKPAPPQEDIQEVLNYIEALRYGLSRLSNLPVSLRLLRELHERLMAGVRGHQATPGEFRHYQNWIGRHGDGIHAARFVPPPVVEMDAALNQMETYIHSAGRYPPLIRLGLIHYQFEAIHPFLDGNGRIGRLLISLLLHEWALLPLPLLYLSAYFERQRRDYYDLLLAVSQRGTWNEWLIFFLNGVAEQSRDATKRVKQLQDIQQTWRQTLTTARSSSLALQLADSLFENPVLTIPQAQRRLGVRSYHTAQRHVEMLVDAGVLRVWQGEEQTRMFIADAIFEVIT